MPPGDQEESRLKQSLETAHVPEPGPPVTRCPARIWPGWTLTDRAHVPFVGGADPPESHALQRPDDSAVGSARQARAQPGSIY